MQAAPPHSEPFGAVGAMRTCLQTGERLQAAIIAPNGSAWEEELLTQRLQHCNTPPRLRPGLEQRKTPPSHS